MVDDVNLGGDIDEALQALNDRLGSKDFDIVATAITIQRTAGGHLADILSGVAETVRVAELRRAGAGGLDTGAPVRVVGLELALEVEKA